MLFGILTLIAVLGMLNLTRFFIMQVFSDIYDIKQARIRKLNSLKRSYRPRISVIIPAHNEEMGVIRTLESVLANQYANKQVIVVDDGSTDKTNKILKNFQRRHRKQFTIVTQVNGGKAAALNNGIKHYADGQLVMVLDADSLIAPDGIEKMVAHFRNRHVIAAASNVKIIHSSSSLGIAQRFEYLISYRIKRSLSVLNMEYIIGGVGSTFRRSKLLKIGVYDEDTITEDIDMTLKLIRVFGNKKGSITYASDVKTYTEHVLTFRSLIRQRFRWKYGRFQSFLKNRSLFFSIKKPYDKRLTFYQLPYALFGEMILMIEPLLVLAIITMAVVSLDIQSLLYMYAIVSGMIFLIVLGEDTESFKTKLVLTATLPLMYFLMYILTVVEFIALFQSIKKSRQINGTMAHATWQHVERSGQAVKL